MPTGSSEVLFVCTANRCRSPLAESLLLANAGAAGLPWAVQSAGTHARVGDVTEPEVIDVLREVGIDAARRASRRLEPPALGQAALVLTAERRHRSIALEQAPQLVGRVFTMLELERLLRAVGAAPQPRDLVALAGLADSARAAAGPGGDHDDLADPIGRGLEAFRRCRSTLSRVVDVLVGTMVGRPGF